MSSWIKDLVLPLCLWLFIPAAFSPAFAGVLTSRLQSVIADLPPGEEVPVIVTFSDRTDFRSVKGLKRSHRPGAVVRAMKKTAEFSQGGLRDFLEMRGKKGIKPLWVINGLALKARVDELPLLAAWPGVESLKFDEAIPGPRILPQATNGVEDNLWSVRVPELWNLGLQGQGVVIALMDTGVDASHPDLAARYRGGTNSWFDPSGEQATPTDLTGHGTSVAGVLVGGDAGGTSLGVAPQAQWIAVRIFNDANLAPLSLIHEGFQWLLDPDGNPATDDAPDVVNNSWGFEDAIGCTDATNPNPDFNADFHPDLQALRAAGIAVVFAAGNTGPAASTSISPGNYPEAFAVGAVNGNRSILPVSARGPSACDLTVFPELVAPGAQILTTALSGLVPPYAEATGTSFSAPHVAGIMALLRQRFPEVTVDGLERTLTATAVDLGSSGPDNTFGFGMVDALAAHQSLLGNQPPQAPLLRTPTDGQGNLGSAVTFSWERSADPDGDAVAFRLIFADNLQFLNPSEVVAGGFTGTASLAAGMGLGWLLLIFGGSGSPVRRLKGWLLLVLLGGALATVSCGGGGGDNGVPVPDDGEVTVSVTGLQPATTYFWKVVAEDGRGGLAESAVRSFTTR